MNESVIRSSFLTLHSMLVADGQCSVVSEGFARLTLCPLSSFCLTCVSV